jgi:hypothetical protein
MPVDVFAEGLDETDLDYKSPRLHDAGYSSVRIEDCGARHPSPIDFEIDGC